jgi:hypothetical protein
LTAKPNKATGSWAVLPRAVTGACVAAGRAIEAGFDAAATAWWVAGGIYLGLR